ncbi:MAG: hypothetical protein ACD_3C00164G0002 [uncultured bacterium (gcode 4)]|uniref:DUF1508 domain-containing protein n=1 Tax=uncultured bacterium (gcode 4) TaxID=1234023 RepID=K2GWL0_9BACT|nr:MAG: hypothetical protein ACD_3C00164G0002 [uncultured bacterium (gcode 4)]
MAKFELLKNSKWETYWHLKANNWEKICWSEWYSSKQNALDSINFVKVNAKESPISDNT